MRPEAAAGCRRRRPRADPAVSPWLALRSCCCQCVQPAHLRQAGHRRERLRADRATRSASSDTSAARRRSARAHLQLVAGSDCCSGDYAAAESEARKALKLDPDSADAYTLLAVHRPSAAATPPRPASTTSAPPNWRRASGGALNNYGTWLCGQRPRGRVAGLVRPRAGRSRLRALRRRRWPMPAAAPLQAGQDARAERDLRRRHRSSTRTMPWRLAALAEQRVPPGRRLRGAGVLGAPSGCCTSGRAARCYLRHKSKRNSATGQPPHDTFSD